MPILVQAIKDRINDAVDALYFGEDNHGTSAAAREGTKVQQLRQVFSQASHHARVGALPVPLEAGEGASALRQAVCLVNRQHIALAAMTTRF